MRPGRPRYKRFTRFTRFTSLTSAPRGGRSGGRVGRLSLLQRSRAPRRPEPAGMKVRSIPFSFWSNRGLQECSSEAAAPQICIMQNRNSVHFWVLAKSFIQKHNLGGCTLDATPNPSPESLGAKIDKDDKTPPGHIDSIYLIYSITLFTPLTPFTPFTSAAGLSGPPVRPATKITQICLIQ